MEWWMMCSVLIHGMWWVVFARRQQLCVCTDIHCGEGEGVALESSFGYVCMYERGHIWSTSSRSWPCPCVASPHLSIHAHTPTAHILSQILSLPSLVGTWSIDLVSIEPSSLSSPSSWWARRYLPSLQVWEHVHVHVHVSSVSVSMQILHLECNTRFYVRFTLCAHRVRRANTNTNPHPHSHTFVCNVLYVHTTYMRTRHMRTHRRKVLFVGHFRSGCLWHRRRVFDCRPIHHTLSMVQGIYASSNEACMHVYLYSRVQSYSYSCVGVQTNWIQLWLASKCSHTHEYMYTYE